MATIHFILQGKGGVGKSMIACFLYQACKHWEKEVVAYDTDPVNATLASFPEFDVRRIEIMRQGMIETRNFDTMYQYMLHNESDNQVIVDNGASSFVVLDQYIQENLVMESLAAKGHTIYLHSVVAGGQLMGTTFDGLASICEHFPDTPKVVWVNPFFGDVATPKIKSFEEFNIYKEFCSQFHALIRLPVVNPSTFGRDIEDLFSMKMSFHAGIHCGEFSTPSQIRLDRYWKNILQLIADSNII